MAKEKPEKTEEQIAISKDWSTVEFCTQFSD